MIVVNLEDDNTIEKREQKRQEAAERVGTEEPVYVQYFPSFDAAKALLERRDHEGDTN